MCDLNTLTGVLELLWVPQTRRIPQATSVWEQPLWEFVVGQLDWILILCRTVRLPGTTSNLMMMKGRRQRAAATRAGPTGNSLPPLEQPQAKRARAVKAEIHSPDETFSVAERAEVSMFSPPAHELPAKSGYCIIDDDAIN